MDETDLRSALHAEERHAPHAGAVLAGVDQALHFRRSRRIALQVGVLVVVIGLVASLPTLVRKQEDNAVPVATTSATAPESAEPTGLTAAQLAAGHWTAMPPAPIQVRQPAASAWTGTQLIVWGGADASYATHSHADGAAYDPAARTWETLPVSPLSARSQSAFAWTGSEVFIWGGFFGEGDKYPTAELDGAMYNPSTRTWRTIPAAPVTGYQQAAAFWTGTDIVLLTLENYTGTSEITTSRFNPTSNTWTQQTPVTAATTVSYFVAALAGSTVVLWTMWISPDAQQSSSPPWGVDTYTLAHGAAGWASVTIPTAGFGGISQVSWTGTQLLVGAAPRWCGVCSQPVPINMSGFRVDASLRTATEIPHGPVDDLSPTYQWTGSAWLAFGTTGTRGDGTTTQYPGEAAAWDSSSNNWVNVPGAPLTPREGAATAWTGSALLIWGHLDPGSPDVPQVASTGGLELSA